MTDTQTEKQAATRRDWTKIGREFYDEGTAYGLECRGAATQQIVARECDRLEWLEVPKDGSALELPMMPGEALKTMVRELHIPKVSHVGYSHGLAPYGLIAAFGHYKNADVKVYAVDKGTSTVILAMDVYEKAGA
jgi:hypothetical protein